MMIEKLQKMLVFLFPIFSITKAIPESSTINQCFQNVSKQKTSMTNIFDKAYVLAKKQPF